MSVAEKPRTVTKRALVIARRGDDQRSIGETLRRHQIDPVTIGQAGLGFPIAQTIQQQIASSDMVVAVLGEGRGDVNISFELGMAKALKKHILVLVPPNYPADFPISSGLPYIRATGSNDRALDYALTQLLAAPPSKDEVIGPIPASKPIGNELADLLLQRLGNLPQDHPEADFEKIIAEALVHSIGPVFSPGPGDRGTDFAVWIDDLEPVISNPLLVELRLRIHSQEDVDRIVGQAARTLALVDRGWMLVIYLEGEPELWKDTYAVVNASWISAPDFLNAVRTKSVTQVVHELRNRQTHRVL